MATHTYPQTSDVLRDGERIHVPLYLVDERPAGMPVRSPLADAAALADAAYLKSCDTLNAWRNEPTATYRTDSDPVARHGTIYSSLAAGERATPVGESFAVRTAGGALTWYRRDQTYSEKLHVVADPTRRSTVPASTGDAAEIADAAWRKSVEDLNAWRNR